MKKNKKIIDMTSGSIMRQIVLFAIPICIGNVLQQLYNTVDTLVIGNYCSKSALAAVGTSAQPVEMLLCLFIGLGAGVSILVSKATGSGNQQCLKDTISTAHAVLFCSAIPLTFIGLLLVTPLLKMMQIPNDTWDYAYSYLSIVFLGILGNLGYNMNAGILRGLGDSTSSFLLLLFSCVLNIILDILFVVIFKFNVSGAAAATIISMYASWVMSLIYLKKSFPELDIKLIPRTVNKSIISNIIKLGLPLGINNSLFSVGHIILQILVNAQGSSFMAACSIATKITGLANVAIASFSSAASTYSAQNLGAANYGRLKKGAFAIPFYSGVISLISGVLVTLVCRPLIALFSDDIDVIYLAVKYVQIVLPFTWPFAVFNTTMNYVNGLGEVKYPLFVSMAMLWFVRVPIAYILFKMNTGIYMVACYPISFTFGMIAISLIFLSKKWKKITSAAN